MTWNPVETAPENVRVLVRSHDVEIGTLSSVLEGFDVPEWADDQGFLIDPVTGWLPLPDLETDDD